MHIRRVDLAAQYADLKRLRREVYLLEEIAGQARQDLRSSRLTKRNLLGSSPANAATTRQ